MIRSIPIAVILAATLTWVASANEKKEADKPKLKLEFRWAEEKPTEGVTEGKGVDLSCTDKKAFLHKQAILTNEDVASTHLLEWNSAPDQLYFIKLDLSKAAAERMADSSVKHMSKPLVVLVDGKIVAAMTPMVKLSEFVLITGSFKKAEAERIAEGIKAK